METSLSKLEHYNALQRLEMCVQMFDSPMVRNSNDLDIDKVVLPAILKAQKDLGYGPNEDKLTHLMTGISTEIKKSVPNLRLSEIPIAINDGVLGLYGDFIGLSIVSVIKFLKSHYESLKRAELAKQIKPKEEAKQPPTLEEQKIIAKQHLIDEFEKFKTTKTIPLSGVYLYRFLSEHFGLVSFSNELKYRMYYEASKVIVKGLKDEIIANPNSRLSNSKKIGEIENLYSIEDDPIKCAIAIHKGLQNEELKIQIRNESERIALKRYFNDLIEMETEIKDLLNEE